MKRKEIERLNEEVERPYKWTRRTIKDVYGNEYHYIQISKMSPYDEQEYYWAMNTDNNIEGNWAIKRGSKFYERIIGLDDLLAELRVLNSTLEPIRAIY